MATFEARGYANKVTVAQSSGGKDYCKFTLSVQQKRKDRTGQELKEKLWVNCVTFDPENFPSEGEYIGATGYVTIFQWSANGKTGVSIDLKVNSVERLAQRDAKGKGGTSALPADPFALPGDEDLGI